MINLVYPTDWILNRIGRETEGLEGDGTYFINYALYDETQPRPHGALFTHIEPATQKIFDEVAGKVDYAVCLNSTVKKYLEDKGVKRVEIIQHGFDPRVKKNPVFGYCGRVYKSGRKGTDLLEGIDVIFHDDFDTVPEFYKKIDYLLIPSRIEGGPVPVLDAIAAGVPFIGREGVGWIDDFPGIKFKTDEEFKQIIWKLQNPPSWEQWREKHQNLFRSFSKN